MKKVNLKKLYWEKFSLNFDAESPEDYNIELSDDILELYQQFFLDDERQRKKLERNRVFISLDITPDIESAASAILLSVEEEVQDKAELECKSQMLHSALNQLSEKQARRIIAHYILGLKKVEIAQIEGVNERAIRSSIQRGLKQLEKKIKKIWPEGVRF